jgi:kinesin family protein 18/19
MAGTIEDPGLMVLSLQAIFALITKQESEYEFEVTASYLEVYNEVIYDLLESSSGHLELREDPDQGITVAGLKRIQVNFIICALFLDSIMRQSMWNNIPLL